MALKYPQACTPFLVNLRQKRYPFLDMALVQISNYALLWREHNRRTVGLERTEINDRAKAVYESGCVMYKGGD